MAPSTPSPPVRRLLLAAGMLGCAWCAMPSRAHAVQGGWPLWEAFAEGFIQADGRVIDDQHGTRYTTSEGQAYSLFFALVTNDRTRFTTLLRWTSEHLAGGALGQRLPGWRWGQGDDGRWGLRDANAASDADLWLVHTLFEAARLWRHPPYRALALALLARVREQEIVTLEGAGPMLLPGPQGFVHADGAVRLNPSYLPLHQLRALAREDPPGPWLSMARGLGPFLRAIGPHGLAPDWVMHARGRGWHSAPAAPAVGSHDAIRVYLWAGLAHRADPQWRDVIESVSGMVKVLTEGVPPQSVCTDTGAGSGEGPPGFSAALLPYLKALGRLDLMKGQLRRVEAARTPASGPLPATAARSRGAEGWLVGSRPTYYDQVLTLFGTGAVAGRFGFDPEGRLWTAWAPPGHGVQDKARPT